jgi:hypothetical protein
MLAMPLGFRGVLKVILSRYSFPFYPPLTISRAFLMIVVVLLGLSGEKYGVRKNSYSTQSRRNNGFSGLE